MVYTLVDHKMSKSAACGSWFHLRWPNTVCARFTDSASDAIKRALGLWYANTAVDKVIRQFHMKLIIKLSFDPK